MLAPVVCRCPGCQQPARLGAWLRQATKPPRTCSSRPGTHFSLKNRFSGFLLPQRLVIHFGLEKTPVPTPVPFLRAVAPWRPSQSEMSPTETDAPGNMGQPGSTLLSHLPASHGPPVSTLHGRAPLHGTGRHGQRQPRVGTAPGKELVEL